MLDAVDSNNKTPLRLAMGREYKEIVYYLQGKLNRIVSCKLRCASFVVNIVSYGLETERLEQNRTSMH